MRKTIENELCRIEKEQQIRILFACESGSRAWGFPSPDSDYDVRFIYVRPLSWYLSIQKRADQLTFPINNELDISGWDLGKTLQLIARSNAVPFEWLQSPVVYKETQLFQNRLWTLCQSFFCVRTNVHHYLGIAKGARDSIDKGKIKIKKLFYMLRPLLSAQWCIERESIAPMNIYPLMDLLPADLKQEVLALIDLKETSDEQLLIQLDKEMLSWIDDTFLSCSLKIESLKKKQFEISEADGFFRKMIKE